MSEHEALARFHYGCAARTTMEMQGWARIADRDIAEQRQDLDLLADGDFLVLLGFPLEIPEHGAAECADRGDRGGLNLLLSHEFAEFADDLVTGVEHDRISDRGIGIEQFRTHVALTIQLGVGVEVAPIRRLLDVAEIVQIARGSSIRNTMLSVR